jgi:DNA repair exonuclease SbcCD nuclease subunit
MTTDDIVMIVASDIHLSHNAPTARSQEPNWYAAMIRQLKWLYELQQKYNVPIVIAGDLMHTFNQPAELINMAIEHMPRVYAICGQHDQPYHDQTQIQKSAYWTLVCAKKVTHLDTEVSLTIKGTNVTIYPFSYGVPVTRSTKKKTELTIGVVHQYCWNEGSSYPYALPEQHVREQYKYGYDVMVFGDNHIGFTHQSGSQSVINCGTFYRRSISERLYQPFVGLITSQGQVIKQFIPVNEDIITDKIVNKTESDNSSVSEFVSYLSEVTVNGFDIPHIFAEYMSKHSTDACVQQEIERLLNVTNI